MGDFFWRFVGAKEKLRNSVFILRLRFGLFLGRDSLFLVVHVAFFRLFSPLPFALLS